jgi:hypothetical protein
MSTNSEEIEVGAWINLHVDLFKKANPQLKPFKGADALHGGNNNVDIAISKDAVVVIDLPRLKYSAKIEVKAGWQLIVYREYSQFQGGKAIATIYAPTEQITIKSGAKPKRFAV